MLAAVQSAIFSRLTGYTALTALLANGSGSVVDFMPQESVAFPFVQIGQMSASEFDADDRLGAQVSVQVDSWSQHRGKQECQQIMAQVYNALHRHSALSVTGYNTVDVLWDGLSTVMSDPDGLSFHGVQTFRVTITQAA